MYPPAPALYGVPSPAGATGVPAVGAPGNCVPGAIPPVGECYGLDTVVDDSIEEQPEVYLEGGDHATLVHMSQEQFAGLTSTAQHGRFSTRH